MLPSSNTVLCIVHGHLSERVNIHFIICVVTGVGILIQKVMSSFRSRVVLMTMMSSDMNKALVSDRKASGHQKPDLNSWDNQTWNIASR